MARTLGLTTILLLLGVYAAAAQQPPAAEPIAPHLSLLPGAILPERGPDGNTVLIEGPNGLVVVDTGRHVWHSDAILAFARAKGLPVAAIVNTHWHLDHSSGNRRLKTVFPAAPVYATNAVDGALQPNGFLMREFAKMPGYLADPGLGETQHDEVRLAMDTMAHRDSLRPDRVVSRAGAVSLAGRTLNVHVTAGAVTDADLWLHDPVTDVVVLGDLVTFPAPFFETACPDKWRDALSDVMSVPFKLAIPGHGGSMSRDDVASYQRAFNDFVDCASSRQTDQACATGWAKGIERFLTTADATAEATSYARYYSGFLRRNKGKSPDCKAG